MKTISGLLLFLFFHSAFAETAWEKYLENPTPKQAALVNKVEASDQGNAGGDSELQILQNQVLAQDSEAFQLAYRLYKSSDGGLAEDLGALLARTIRAHPQFFLQQIALLKVPCTKLAWVLNTPGLEYTDRPNAKNYEMNMRKKALRGVQTRELADIRDLCIKEFRGD